MIGANDRQQMIGDGLNEKFGTDPWYLAYEERVQQFGKLVTSRHIPCSGSACRPSALIR